MNYAPLARIAIRYGVGAVIGLSWGSALAADQDLVTLVALAIGAAVETAYAIAKRRGWAT